MRKNAVRSGSAAGGWREQRGTTLTELAVVVAIFAMITGGTVLVWEQTQRLYFQGSEAAEFQGNLRVALDQIAHDLRRAGRDVTGALTGAGPGNWFMSGSSGLPTATTVEVKMDLDDSGTITASSDEDVAYAFDAANQRVTRNGSTLAESIGNLAFQYWWSPVVGTGCGVGSPTSGSAPSAAQVACVRRVTVTMTGQVTIGGEVVSRTVQTDVDLPAR